MSGVNKALRICYDGKKKFSAERIEPLTSEFDRRHLNHAEFDRRHQAPNYYIFSCSRN